jgi:hypothetical protein
MILAYEMSMFARELAREGIRRDHPDWSEAQIARGIIAAGLSSGTVAAWAAMSIQDVLQRKCSRRPGFVCSRDAGPIALHQ